MERVRELLDDGLGYDPTLFADFVELGWTGMHLPETAGGSGVAFADTAVVISELGRAVTAGPLVSSAIIAAGALTLSSNTDQAALLLPGIVDGSVKATVALAGGGGHSTAAALGPCWRSAAGGGVIVDGEATVTVAGESRDVKAGDVIVINRGVRHSVVSEKGLTFFEALAPVPLDHVPDRDRDLVLGPDGGSGHVER